MDKIIRIVSLNENSYDYSIINKYNISEIDNYADTHFKGNIDWDTIKPHYTLSIMTWGIKI